MSIILNPSLAAQNSLAMIAALSCVEFLREIPLYSAGAEPSKKTLTTKFLIAVIIVFAVMIIMFTYEAPDVHVPPAQPGSATVRS
jgi:hypothetical protein